MLIFDEELIKKPEFGKKYDTVVGNREFFNSGQEVLSANKYLEINQTAKLDRDFWRSVDSVTTRVFRSDGGIELLSDLMSIGEAINIGKTAVLYRVSSDAGRVTRSMSGQVPEDLDKVIYDYNGDPIPVFSTGYGREWREWSGMSSENFDAISDDQEAHAFKIKNDMAKYLLFGDDKIVHEGYRAAGITNHDATQQISLATIDLQTAKPDDIMAFFSKSFLSVLHANYCMQPVDLWISPSILRNLGMPFSNSQGFKGGTILDYVLKLPMINSVKCTFELVGNHFIAFVKNPLYIKPKIAAPVSTVPVQRKNPFDNYNFMLWSSFGLQIKKDYNGRSKVFNAKGNQTPLKV